MRLLLLSTLLLATAARVLAQVPPQPVDACVLLENPDSWRGKLVSVEGEVAIPVEDPNYFLETPECATTLPGGQRRFWNFLELVPPPPRAKFTWDAKSRSQLDHAIEWVDPTKNIVVATVVGIFETSRNRGSPLAQEIDQLLVKTLTRVKTVPRTIPPSADSLRAYESIGERRGMVLWKLLREALQNQGKQYFDESVRGALLPGGARGIHFLHGRVLRVDASTVEIESFPGVGPDIRLRVNNSHLDGLYPGAKVAFRGVALTFSPSPFYIEFDVQPGDLKVIDR